MGQGGQYWKRPNPGPVAYATLRPERKVAVIWENQQAADRLAEIAPALLEQDPRIQTVYLRAEGSRFSADAAGYGRNFDGLVLPWAQGVNFDYDLALTANLGHSSRLEQLRAPTVVLPHGVGTSKVIEPGSGYGPPLRAPERSNAVHSHLVRHGRVTPGALAVAHERQRDAIAAAVPEAAEVTHVVGDPSFDRALAAVPAREHFRRAVGVGADERLVLLSSSWGPHSALATHPELVDRLVSELPRGHVAAALFHPWVWAGHSPRQVRAWLADARRRGLRLLAPTSPWLGLVLAADVVLGDHGSTTYYAAALGASVLFAGGRLANIAPGSQMADLHGRALRYRAEEPLARQVAVAAQVPGRAAHYGALLTSVPGESAARLRRLLYGFLELDEPDAAAALDPLREPRFTDADHRSFGAEHRGEAA